MKNKNNGGYAAITTVIILALVLGAFVLTTLTIVENNYKAQKTAFARQQEIYAEQGVLEAFCAGIEAIDNDNNSQFSDRLQEIANSAGVTLTIPDECTFSVSGSTVSYKIKASASGGRIEAEITLTLTPAADYETSHKITVSTAYTYTIDAPSASEEETGSENS